MKSQSYLSTKLQSPRSVTRGKNSETLQPYFADDELQKAVNLALLLKRPLLIMGEPGCGKSLLAKAVAYEWYGEEMYSKNKYFEWNVKSTSKAREGLYDFDHLLRLRDANAKVRGVNAADKKQYRRFGPMAEAMRNSTGEEKSVLLVDEIDKADIDFSNDLLNEIDRNEFYVPETGERVSFSQDDRPFIIITSNGEKDLSDAFLRRCIFHYIDLFSPSKIGSDKTTKWLTEIIRARFSSGTKKVDDPLVDRAIKTFLNLRKKMSDGSGSFRKMVSTSEFIDWFEALNGYSQREGLAGDKELEQWLKGEAGSTVPLPFGNLLLKTTTSLLNFKEIEL